MNLGTSPSLPKKCVFCRLTTVVLENDPGWQGLNLTLE